MEFNCSLNKKNIEKVWPNTQLYFDEIIRNDSLSHDDDD